MKWLSILLVLLLLGACSAPAGLSATKKTEKNTTAEQQESPAEQQESATEEKPEPTQEEEDKALEIERPEGLTIKDRIDITLSGGKGTIKGTVKGTTKEVIKDYDDVDALIFDAADLFSVTLYEARYMTYVNGNRFLKPSEIENVQEEVSTIEDPTLDTSNIGYTLEQDTGFLRGVGCDRDAGVLVVKLFNDDEEDHKLYRNVKPQIKNALVFRFNKKVLDTIQCANSEGKTTELIETGKEYRCHKSNVDFVEDLHGTLAEDIDREDLKNEVAIGIPGRNEITYFSCPESPVVLAGPEINTTTNETNTTA